MTSGSCRHVQILDYFDDADLTEDKSSTCCDNCSKRVAPADWQQQCLLIVQALDQQSVTATQLANILSGARKEDGKLSQFSGKMKAFKLDTIRNLIEELFGCGLLEVTKSCRRSTLSASSSPLPTRERSSSKIPPPFSSSGPVVTKRKNFSDFSRLPNKK